MDKQILCLLSLLIGLVAVFSDEFSNCLMIYKEGGAPAVIQSPKCPRWRLSSDDSSRKMANCQVAMLQGRRRTQEDRTFCNLDLRIPFPGKMGLKEIKVGLIAVFDGHNGAEASEMASKLLLEYFLLHTYFLLDGIYTLALKKSAERLLHMGEQDMIFPVFNQENERGQHNFKLARSNWILSWIFDGSIHMEILKESLLRAIRDIDATFSKEALKNNLNSGSTATIILKVDGHVLVANIGDSKALLCSECLRSHQELKGTFPKAYGRRRKIDAIIPVEEYENDQLAASDGSSYLCVKELTQDHHPDRDDERIRVEAAGGYVVEWGGVPRVNGELAVSRAIGDVPFKSYGVISVPEVTDWQPLSSNDSYLVVATDGIFDKLTTQDICGLLWKVHRQRTNQAEFFAVDANSLADCIVKTAFERGSMDNMAAVVIPLSSTDTYGTLLNDGCELEGSFDSKACGLQNLISMTSVQDPVATIDGGTEARHEETQAAVVTSSGLIPVENAHQIITNFNKLIEGADDISGCFHLFENLNQDMDYVFQAQRVVEENGMGDGLRALPKALGYHHSEWNLDLYNDHNICLKFGMDIEGEEGKCINPEGFAGVLGLIGSIPFYDSGSNSSKYSIFDTPDFRYTLKRRFDRGSYGEVWLAFHWNCSELEDNSNRMRQSKSCSVNNVHLDPYEYEAGAQINSSANHCFTDPGIEDLFILKRIMVERGSTTYLSGLREKYFGEIFLNASMSLKGYAWNSASSSDRFLGNFRKPGGGKEEGLEHIARYVEFFESQSKEIWLVFQNEGMSLSKLMYTAEEMKNITNEERNEHVRNIQVLRPSSWWHWLKKTEAGKEQMRNLIRQLLLALKSCHDRNITHRDIKPENMVICFEDDGTGKCLRGSPSGEKPYHIKMRIIDFGSAIDDFTIKHLYGSSGPSRSEQTFEYMPPEAILNASWFQEPPNVALKYVESLFDGGKYDMWSVGVVMLELILGSPHVFQISARTRALLDQHLEGWNDSMKELAYKLRAFMEMCILVPGGSPKRHQTSAMKDHDGVCLASWKCSEEAFSHQVKTRDPLNLGFPNVWAMRLVRQLLMWCPEDRLTVDEALSHPYFHTHHQT